MHTLYLTEEMPGLCSVEKLDALRCIGDDNVSIQCIVSNHQYTEVDMFQDAREPVREHAAWLDQEKADKEFRVAEKKRRSVPAPVEVILCFSLSLNLSISSAVSFKFNLSSSLILNGA